MMAKAWIIRLHRWLTLIFAVPLALVILTGLVLSFEPIVQVSTLKPGSITPQQVLALLQRHDPDGQARGLVLRSYEDRLSIRGGANGSIDVNVRTGDVIEGEGLLSSVFIYSRIIHEHIVPGFGWLVQTTTVALIVLIGLGVSLGWPRLANTFSGWHQAVAWAGLPLLILSPLTGLFLAWGISFAGRAPPPAPAIPLAEAVAKVGETHDLANLVWLQSRGGHQLARIIVDGEYQIHAVSRDGVIQTPRNWVRIFHEGNFAGIWSGVLNAVISLGFIVLMVSGLIIWARRRSLRRRPASARGKLAAARASALTTSRS